MTRVYWFCGNGISLHAWLALMRVVFGNVNITWTCPVITNPRQFA